MRLQKEADEAEQQRVYLEKRKRDFEELQIMQLSRSRKEAIKIKEKIKAAERIKY